MPSKPRILLAALAAALLMVAPAGGALVAPVLTGPDDGASVQELPAFKWNAVSGADHYEFELSADTGFNSVVSSASTKNTRAAAKTVVANGTYYWRVRAVTSAGELGAWSETRSLEMAWTARPSLLAPAHGATVNYPADALKLSWSVVPGAAKYLVRVATDPALGSLVTASPVETAATSWTLRSPLAQGTYYWSITPLDPEGHAGTASTVASFNWVWPSTTTGAVDDLVAAPELYDPQLSWNPIPGAAGYEVEINFSSDWASGSKVCCSPLSAFTDASTLGTSLSPKVVLDNNTYYWRVRALDSAGNAGSWNPGPPFTKTFDNVPPVTAPSVKNLHMRDNLADPATDTNGGTTVVDTDVPVVTWDPVPGASGYEVNVAGYSAGACDWATAPWLKETATTAWTPLGWSRTSGSPYPSAVTISSDFSTDLVSGQEYCVRVRAVDRPSATGGPTISGDWAYLPANNQAAFKWNGPPAAAACSPCSMTGMDYVTPLTGTTVGRTPLFTWKAFPGAESYYVLVSRDANFTTIVDYAYTRIPAYAPRTAVMSKGYADETSLYYWAVLPADAPDGSGVSAEPLSSGAQSFTKQSTPTTLLGPIGGAAVNTPATTFRWTPVEGARRYRLEVASDVNFSNLEEDAVFTDSTSYTSNWTYPSDRTLYWRVRADAENGSAFVGLTWSASGTFMKQLPKPVFDPDNPTLGAAIPSFSWSPVPGAVSYDIDVHESDGDQSLFKDFSTHAASFIKFTGVGVTTVYVRANFPTRTNETVDGPWSDAWSYTHTIPEPSNATEDAGANRLLLSWDPRPAASKYRVQVSKQAAFTSTVENTTTQTSAYAPLLTQYDYRQGGTFYWRVAMIDADANQGDFTGVRSFTLPAATSGGTTPQRFRLLASGYPVKNRYRTITLTVRNVSYQLVSGAAVRVSGAGVAPRTRYTSALGKVSFRIRATRYPGVVTFRVTKSGFPAKSLSRAVRRS